MASVYEGGDGTTAEGVSLKEVVGAEAEDWKGWGLRVEQRSDPRL